MKDQTIPRVLKVSQVPRARDTRGTRYSCGTIAFTLIELLVAITIIGILMGIGFVAFKQAQMAGRDTKRKADLEQIRTALEFLRNDCGSYPPSISFGSSLERDCDADNMIETYLAKVPQDPSNSQGYTYCYGSTSRNSYILAGFLERGNADAANDAIAQLCYMSGSVRCNGTEVFCNYSLQQP